MKAKIISWREKRNIFVRFTFNYCCCCCCCCSLHNVLPISFMADYYIYASNMCPKIISYTHNQQLDYSVWVCATGAICLRRVWVLRVFVLCVNFFVECVNGTNKKSVLVVWYYTLECKISMLSSCILFFKYTFFSRSVVACFFAVLFEKIIFVRRIVTSMYYAKWKWKEDVWGAIAAVKIGTPTSFFGEIFFGRSRVILSEVTIWFSYSKRILFCSRCRCCCWWWCYSELVSSTLTLLCIHPSSM